MKLKNIVLLLAAGLSTGVVMASSFAKLGLRTASYGGEIFFIPMVALLVWLGWMLRGEYRYIGKVKHIKKNNKQG